MLVKKTEQGQYIPWTPGGHLPVHYSGRRQANDGGR